MDDPRVYYHSLQLPVDTGAVLYFDLPLRAEMSKDKFRIASTCHAFKQLLSLHIDRELRKLSDFREVLVFESLDAITTSMPVLRIAFLFSKRVSVDEYFKNMGLPYLFTDILPQFSGNFHTNVDIFDIIHEVLRSFDELVNIRITSLLSYRKDILLHILQVSHFSFLLFHRTLFVFFTVLFFNHDSFNSDYNSAFRLRSNVDSRKSSWTTEEKAGKKF